MNAIPRWLMLICEQVQAKAGNSAEATAVVDSGRTRQPVHDVYNGTDSDNVPSVRTPSGLLAVQSAHETVLHLPPTHPGESSNGHTYGSCNILSDYQSRFSFHGLILPSVFYTVGWTTGRSSRPVKQTLRVLVWWP